MATKKSPANGVAEESRVSAKQQARDTKSEKERVREAAGESVSAAEPAPDAGPEVFVSYSHKDAEARDWFLGERTVRLGRGRLKLWSDQKIAASAHWREEIENALARAAVAVLLVSKNFLHSEFIQAKELPKILARRQSRDRPMKVVWVQLEPVEDEETKEILEQLGLSEIQRPFAGSLAGTDRTLREEMRRRVFDQIVRIVDPGWWRVRNVIGSDFELQHGLGRKGTLDVFRARDHAMKRWVTISALSETSDRGDEEFNASLLEASRVDDIDAFLTVYDTALDTDPPYCVRQYVEGQTLSKLLELPENTSEHCPGLRFSYARDILIQLGEAVNRAHRRGFYHLNIKPSNVLLDVRDRVFLSPTNRRQLSYFKRLRAEWTSMGDDPRAVEDKAYAIPEFFDRIHPRAMHGRGDQYLLGLLGYHMITGLSPKRVDFGRAPQSIRDFDPLQEICEFNACASCPEGFASTIMRMCNADPHERFETVEQAIDQLRPFRDEWLSLAKDSFRRVCADGSETNDFVAMFYDSFLEKYGDGPGGASLRKLFESPDAKSRQHEMVREAVLLLLAFREFDAPNPRSPTILDRVVRSHRRYRLEERSFVLFEECLIEAMLQFDPFCQRDSVLRGQIKEAWHKALRPGLRYMQRELGVASPVFHAAR